MLPDATSNTFVKSAVVMHAMIGWACRLLSFLARALYKVLVKCPGALLHPVLLVHALTD